MPEYRYNLTLRGSKAGKAGIKRMRFDLGEPADEAAALNAANQIRGALVDITDAFVASESLTLVVSEDNQVPADADVTDIANITVHLNAPTEAQKLHNLPVPAPIDALFLADGVTVDTSNALLIQYVQQIAQHAFVSDGEQVNTASGSNGISGGYWSSEKRTSK